MADPRPLTRAELAKFLPDQRSIRAFEQLFDAIPTDLQDILLAAGNANANANNALAIIEGVTKLAEYAALAPLPQQHNGTHTDYVEFNRFANHEVGQTQVGWNEEDGTVEIGMGYDGVVQQVGLEQYYRIKASADISNGDCVMFTGAVGASGVVTGAPSTGIAEGQYIMGVATMDIANNDFGYITSFGLVRGFRTDGSAVGETWSDGDILWYNPAYVGGLTNVEPAAPNPAVIVAAVIHATSGNSGSLLVRTTFIPTLDQLSNVDITTPSSGQVLSYNGTKWINSSSAGGGTYAAWQIKTANYTASTGEQIACTGTWTLTLPATPAVGDTVVISNVSTGTITIGRNGSNINSVAADGTLLANTSTQVVYIDATIGWKEI